MKARFEEYAHRYPNAVMTRREGILELRLHTGGGPLVWGHQPHSQLGHCFADIGSDPGNRVVILTGTGAEFCARLDGSWVGEFSPQVWDEIFHDARRLLANLLDVEVPVIGAVNGKASIHAELALLSDVVLAAESAVFQDAPHFRRGTVPGDGVHVIWPYLIGPIRARYFLLTGQKLTAEEGLRLGFVNEVLPDEQLLGRAWELARELAHQPDLTLRYTRAALTRQIKRMLHEDLGFGLALEGLAAHVSWPRGSRAQGPA